MRENFNQFNKKILCLTLVFLVCICFTSTSYAEENQAVDTKQKIEKKQEPQKTSAFKSFVSKFKKTKSDKKQNGISDAENPVATLQGSIILSMEDCVNFALKNDPNISIYQDIQNVQKNSVGQAKSAYFPTIFGSTGYNINNTQYSRGKEDAISNNYFGLNVGVNQLIWDFGKTTANINMSKYNFEAAGYDLQNAILQTIYNVKISYTAVLAARANEDIFARSVRINELNYERTKAMYDVGLKSKIDVVNAQVYLTDAKISLLQAQNNYQSALIKLNNAMFYLNAPDYAIKDTETFNFQKNYSIKNEINIAYDRKNFDENSVEAELKDGAILTSGIEKRDILKTYKFKPFDLTLEDAIQKAYENRPDIKSFELASKASAEALKAIQRSYMPVINASGGYSMMGRSDYSSNGISLFAGVSLPNVNPLSIKYSIEIGKSYLNIADTNVNLLKKNVYFQVQNYYVNMKQLEKRIPLMSQKVEQTLQNFELADGRYSVGLGDYIELQQAQMNYNNAQLAFVQSVFDYNQARFYLEKSIGLK